MCWKEKGQRWGEEEEEEERKRCDGGSAVMNNGGVPRVVFTAAGGRGSGRLLSGGRDWEGTGRWEGGGNSNKNSAASPLGEEGSTVVYNTRWES